MNKQRLYEKQAGLQIRQDAGGRPRIVGYASVFYNGQDGTEFKLWDGAVERIHKKAFDRALEEAQDVVALFNHDDNQLLGRSSAGTLQLSVDRKGLQYDIELPDTELGRSVFQSVTRGDLRGSSFAFWPTRTEWKEGQNGEPSVRVILDLDLVDVGPVVRPAYAGTTAEAASEALREWDQIQTEKREARLREYEKLIAPCPGSG